MNAMENMINEEMVQGVMDTVVEVQPNGSKMMDVLEGGLYAIAGVVIWEGGKFVAKKIRKVIEAKKNNADIVITEADFEDQNA
jgi:hypothetical protein